MIGIPTSPDGNSINTNCRVFPCASHWKKGPRTEQWNWRDGILWRNRPSRWRKWLEQSTGTRADQPSLFEKALRFQKANTPRVDGWEEFVERIEKADSFPPIGTEPQRPKNGSRKKPKDHPLHPLMPKKRMEMRLQWKPIESGFVRKSILSGMNEQERIGVVASDRAPQAVWRNAQRASGNCVP